MDKNEVKPGVEVIQVIPYVNKEEWPETTIKTVAYQKGDSGWICKLENGEIEKIENLLKII